MGLSLQAILLLINFLLLMLVAACLGYVAHKCRRIYLKQFAADGLAAARSDNLYAQLEMRMALEKDLQLPCALPLTRGWAGSPDFLRHVHRIAMSLRPENIVECSSGTSTVVLARTAQMLGRGHVYSLEHDPVFARKTRAELERNGLQAYATVLDAPLRDHVLAGAHWRWYETAGLPDAIDLLVIDGPPSTTQALARYPAVPALNDRISKGGCVVLDDADRPDERAAVARWKSEFQYVSGEDLFAEKGIAFLKRQGG